MHAANLLSNMVMHAANLLSSMVMHAANLLRTASVSLKDSRRRVALSDMMCV